MGIIKSLRYVNRDVYASTQPAICHNTGGFGRLWYEVQGKRTQVQAVEVVGGSEVEGGEQRISVISRSGESGRVGCPHLPPLAHFNRTIPNHNLARVE